MMRRRMAYLQYFVLVALFLAIMFASPDGSLLRGIGMIVSAFLIALFLVYGVLLR